MSTFADAFRLFPNAQYSTKVFLSKVYLAVAGISNTIVSLEFYMAILGVILTIFHLTVLTRQSMRTSSIMSIMISTAICDLFSMIAAIGTRDIVRNFEYHECSPPITYASFVFYGIIQSLRDDVIRISTWLSVTMALIRYLVLKLAPRPGGLQRIQRFHFGFYAFGMASVISTLISWLYYLKSDVALIGEWKPAEHCPSKYPPQPIYDSLPSDLFLDYNELYRVFMFVNGMVSKILPCVLFPILTGLLVLELRKAKKNRKGFSENRAERTTGLVIFMSISFFIALLPSGIMTSLQAVYTDIGFLYMSTYVDLICAALLTFNSCLHCFICFAMSSQYRNTVKGFWKLPDHRRVHSTQSTHSTTNF